MTLISYTSHLYTRAFACVPFFSSADNNDIHTTGDHETLIDLHEHGDLRFR
jgi:hypothetical protein